MDREAIITKVNTDTSSSGTEVTAICQDKLDWVQDDICSRYDFSWLKDYGYLTIVPAYETGTITATQDSTAIAGDGTVFTEAMIGRLIKINEEDEYYEISAYTSTTAITIKSNYVGITNSDLPYVIYKTDYPLASDFKKMLWVKELVTPRSMVSIPEVPFNNYFPDIFERTEDEAPDGYVLTGIDSDGYHTLRPTPIQITRKQLYYCFVKGLATINTEGGESSIPTKWHDAFVFKLNSFVFNLIDIPQKAKYYEDLYEQTISRMVEEDLKRDKATGYIMANEEISGGAIGDI